jgi:Rab family protein
MTEREKSETGNKPKIASIDAKIVLLGDTGVGKTSLALRFVQDAFSSRTAPTVGASFLTKVLYVPISAPFAGIGLNLFIFIAFARLISDCKIKLRIWDTAGTCPSPFSMHIIPFNIIIAFHSIHQGQERFRSLAPMYYRGACAAVIAFDITREESFKKMQDWVKELQINLSEEISTFSTLASSSLSSLASGPPASSMSS